MASANIVNSTLILLAVLLARLSAALYPTSLVYEAPNGTWLENIAVRPDGSILATVLTPAAELYLIQPDPKNPKPQVIPVSNSQSGLLGIAETAPNTYEVVAANFSLATASAAPGSSAIYRVTFPQHPHHYGTDVDGVRVTLTAKLPYDIGLPNGLLKLNDHLLLLADSKAGTILAVNTRTGKTEPVITDPLLTPAGTFGIGVNGLKIHADKLYFTNSGQNIFGRVVVDLKTGRAKGVATLIARGQGPPELPPTVAYDDFALSRDGTAAFLTTTGGNTVARVEIETGVQIIVAGDLNSTEIAQPTAAAFGRVENEGTLFVTTAGGAAVPVNGDEVVGGQVVAVRVGGYH